MDNKNSSIRGREGFKVPPSQTLDGQTLFRFAHMWRHVSSGGIEGYLWKLNRALLERNRMRILQMYLVQDSGPFRIDIEKVGRGELIWVPSILNTNIVGPLRTVKRFWTKVTGRPVFEFSVNHDILLSAIVSYQPRLGVFHWISEDSKAIINHLHANNIPFVVVHHFENASIRRRMVRNQISKAYAVAGVTDIDVPRFVRDRFTTLSDAVDTGFFCPEEAVPLKKRIESAIDLSSRPNI